MTDIIKLLPDHVANQIAAGEVVQRPSSVVKELVENAIDANALSITLVVKDAGKTSIQVIDDGKGMSMIDARMSFERHATSKIAVADDLFNLHTKGFRGEALASIAAIAHVSLKTKRDLDEVGTLIEIEGSKITNQEPVVAPQGTTITVRNLFYNVPARRKFLKSDAVELRNITDEFHRVALAHPEVAMKFIHNDTSLFTLPAAPLRQRIVQIMGGKTNESLVPVDEETELLTVKGFIGKPDWARKTKGLQFFFVNNRFIKHNYLHHAVTSAFEGLLTSNTNPSYFLYLTVPSDSVDLNIHPTKTEVKFDDEHNLYAIIRASVKHALGQFNVHGMDFNHEQQYDVPYEVATGSSLQAPRIDVNPDFNPFKTDSYAENQYDKHNSRNGKGLSHSHFSKPNNSWEALYTGINEVSAIADESHLEQENASLFENKHHQSATIFQFQRKFIMSTLQSGLLVIHQHRAHTRVLYEKLMKQLTIHSGVSQQLLFPLQLHFTKDEVVILQGIQESLESIGFLFKTLADNVVEIEGLPLELKEAEVPRLLEAIILQEQQDLPDNYTTAMEFLAATMASSIAVKTGEIMQPEAMQHLVDSLFSCSDPAITPQGKKIFFTLTGESLNSKFN